MRQEKLVEAIQVKREEMIRIGIAKGLRAEETIRCSQELDRLLNVYVIIQNEDNEMTG
ncbi:Spo0E family sporulation regulatory protein-aspartic acid phosphatase [Bacillus sp. AK128]